MSCKINEVVPLSKAPEHTAVVDIQPEKYASGQINSVFAKASPQSHKTNKRVSVTVEDVMAALSEFAKEERMLIRPDHEFLQNWDVAVFLALIFTATVTPFEVRSQSD